MAKQPTKRQLGSEATQNKRVTILKDAIKQLNAEKYKAKVSNGYVELDDNDDIETIANFLDLVSVDKAEKTELNKFLDLIITPNKPCTVCAKGAIAISAIRKYNNCSVADASYDALDIDASKQAQKIFGEANADLIEEYFENNYICSIDSEDDSSENPYKQKYPDDTDRLIAIFKNAIKNKGVFVP